MADSPITRRSRDFCECAALRHQLELADLLAAQIAPIASDIKAMAANSTEPMCEKDAALVAAFEIYSASRVQYEAEAPGSIAQA